MSSVKGKYYDGKRSRSEDAIVTFVEPNLINIRTSERQFSIDVQTLKISDKIGSIPRKLSWGDLGYIHCENGDDFNQFLISLNKSEGSWVHFFERNLLIAFCAFCVTFAVVIGALVWGVPIASYHIAHNLPDSIYNSTSEKVLAELDDYYLETSTLTIDRQEQLRRYFLSEGNPEFDIHFRSMGGIPNAFSMAGGDIVFTDSLVEMSKSDEELLSIYFHEMGHSQERHAEQMILQQASLSVILIFLTGDVSGVGDLLISLPLFLNQMSHSRQFEREADDISFNLLVEKGYDTQFFADILSRISSTDDYYGHEHCLELAQQSTITATLEGDNQAETSETFTESDLCDEYNSTDTTTVSGDDHNHQHGSWFDYLSTHPATEERIKRFEDYSKAHFHSH